MENQQAEFINLTPENIKDEHLSCIIRSKKPHPGVEAKREWLANRLSEGHVFRKLNAKGCAFIEYAPLERAWVPIEGDNFYYIYCLWASGEFKGKGYGRQLMEYCIADAKKNGKSGVCMLGAAKQKSWLTNQAFAQKYGFEVVDSTNGGYQLYALSFDGTSPRFTASAKAERIDNEKLTIYYDLQCPYILQSLETVRSYCAQNDVEVDFLCVDTLEKAKLLPCAFNNFAVFFKGKFETVNLLLDTETLKRILKK